MKIKDLKEVREKLGLTHLVVFGITPDGKYHVGTHGQSILNSHEAADAGNHLKKVLNFPDHLCDSIPLERVCGNCHYYTSYYGIPDMIDWDRYDITGNCSLMPYKMNTNYENFCLAFEPKLYYEEN
jgi:hypothetical protein